MLTPPPKNPKRFGRTRDIAFVVFPGFQIQDLSGPLAAFEISGKTAIGEVYRCHVVSATGGGVVSSGGLEIMTKTIRSAPYDTMLVMGGEVSVDPLNLPALTKELQEAVEKKTRRIASVCTGAFILATAGLLDGRRATTHWKYSAQLQRHFPKIKIESDRIYTKDGEIWTSAGVTAGIDMALAMIEEDHNSAISHEVSRLMVVYHRRHGNQAQFSAMAEMEPESDRIREILTYMREHLTESLSVDQLATMACLSPRQFGRTFLAETGETPAKAVERLRVELARQKIEGASDPIETIARNVGFTDPERMRRAFIRVFGHPPQNVRRIAHREAS